MPEYNEKLDKNLEKLYCIISREYLLKPTIIHITYAIQIQQIYIHNINFADTTHLHDIVCGYFTPFTMVYLELKLQAWSAIQSTQF